MHPFKAIGLKLISALLFAGMSALVRQLGDVAPIGQMVFFPQRLRDFAGGGDLCVARRACLRRAHRPSVRATRPRHAQCLRHVHEFFGAHAVAARRRDRDLVCLAAHYGCACRRHLEGARAHLPLVGGGDRLCRRDRDADSAFRFGHLCRGGGAAATVGSLFAITLGVLQRRHRDPDPPAHADRNDVVHRVLFLAGLRHRRRADAAVRLAFADRDASSPRSSRSASLAALRIFF